jgi:hypothetical protein
MKKFFTLNGIILTLFLLSGLTASAQIVEPNMTDTVKRSHPTGNKTVVIDTTKVDSTSTEPEGERAQTAFFEIGGPGLALTLNYDMRFGHKRTGLGFRAGAGYFATDGNNVFSVPIQINYLLGKGNSLIELGGGTTFLNSHGNSNGKTFIFDRITGFIGTATIGYRYQPQERGINLRIGFVPIFCDEGIIAAGGVSIGYTFK